MYLHLGQSTVVQKADIVGIFDLDNASWSHRTRAFLERAEREGRLTALGDDLPRSFVVCAGEEGTRIYLTQASAALLKGRAESEAWRARNEEQSVIAH